MPIKELNQFLRLGRKTTKSLPIRLLKFTAHILFLNN